MGQTQTEKDLQKALEALKHVADGTCSGNFQYYAAKVYAELTAPEMEPVEVKVFGIMVGEEGFHRYAFETDARHAESEGLGRFIELTGTFQKPVKEESWEGKISRVDGHHFGVYLAEPVDDERLMGQLVKVEPIIEEGE